MAKKFIDADLLKEEFERRFDMQDLYLPTHFLDVVDSMPAADVQEVRHGKWESTELMYENGCTRCSECKIEYYVSDLEEICGDTLPTYCPNCGARVDGDTNA